MAAYEVLLLNTAIPQIQAAQSGDTYVVPRDIAFSTVASLAAGTEALPSLVATGDVNTGFWFPAADTIAASTGGTRRLTLDSSGNLGLGVTPSAKLEIYSTNNAFNALQVRYNGSNDAMGFGIANSNGFPYLGYNTKSQASVDAPVYERSNPAAQLRMDSGSFKFNIAASGTAGNAISFTQAMTLDASGNLVVGGTSANVGVWNKAITLNTASGNAAYELTVAGSAKGFFAADASNVYLQSSGAIPLIFTTNGSEKARITSGGDLLVGTSSITGARMVVVGSASSTSRVGIIRSTASGDTTYASLLVSKYDNDSTTSQVYVQFSMNNDGTASGQINANGASQVAFGSWSDSRLKENIVDLPSQWDNIKSLRPVEFDYIESEGGGHQVGFVAQDVQDVYPDLVGQRSDGMLTLSGMGKGEARLIKALQEAMARIETLEAEVAALKGA